MKGRMFEGVVTAMATPFRSGRLDEEALRRHVNFQIEAGVNALLPCGTTGESPTLSYEEHKRVVAVTVEEAGGRVPVLAGAGSNNTVEAIDLSRYAQSVGADGLLLVSPYYNRPTQGGLYEHFKAVAEAVDLPIILYNIPGRCGVNILPETMARLAGIPSIVGVKEATGDLSQMIRTIELCGPDFLVTSGDDGLALPLWAVGGRGIISVASNLIPAPMAQMWAAWKNGQWEKTRELFYKMLPIFKGLFLETNPVPLKAALGLTGRMTGEVRLPMTPAAEETMAKLRPILREWGVIND